MFSHTHPPVVNLTLLHVMPLIQAGISPKYPEENIKLCLSDNSIQILPPGQKCLARTKTDCQWVRDLNFVIMDYLVSEGYPSAAQKFAMEANIQPRIDFDSIRERVEIRNAIYSGDIQTAIERINELNPLVSYPAS